MRLRRFRNWTSYRICVIVCELDSIYHVFVGKIHLCVAVRLLPLSKMGIMCMCAQISVCACENVADDTFNNSVSQIFWHSTESNEPDKQWVMIWRRKNSFYMKYACVHSKKKKKTMLDVIWIFTLLGAYDKLTIFFYMHIVFIYWSEYLWPISNIFNYTSLIPRYDFVLTVVGSDWPETAVFVALSHAQSMMSHSINNAHLHII